MKNHIHPAIVTKNNVDHFRQQLKALGFSFDWDREINTTDPEYYKWTQWIFLQLYKKGLAYKKEKPRAFSCWRKWSTLFLVTMAGWMWFFMAKFSVGRPKASQPMGYSTL